MRVVAVFGGGGAKSLAHAGAWRALLEAGLRPSHIVGTSMGAVVGAAFAAGSSYERFVDVAGSLGTKDVAAPDLFAFVKGVFAPAIFRPAPLQHSIARLVPATRFADLQVPLTVTATDIDSGQLVLLGASPGTGAWGDVGAQHAAPLQQSGPSWVHLGTDAPLIDALYASCALPLYFPPGVIDGRRLADGGLRAVLPLDVARRVPADLVVAVDVGPGFDEPPLPPSTVFSRFLPPPLIRAHGEAIRVMMAAQTERAIADWPKDAPRLILVRAVAEREATFAVGAGERYLKAGYEATRRAL